MCILKTGRLILCINMRNPCTPITASGCWAYMKVFLALIQSVPQCFSAAVQPSLQPVNMQLSLDKKCLQTSMYRPQSIQVCNMCNMYRPQSIVHLLPPGKSTAALDSCPRHTLGSCRSSLQQQYISQWQRCQLEPPYSPPLPARAEPPTPWGLHFH